MRDIRTGATIKKTSGRQEKILQGKTKQKDLINPLRLLNCLPRGFSN